MDQFPRHGLQNQRNFFSDGGNVQALRDAHSENKSHAAAVARASRVTRENLRAHRPQEF
jgi:hypothetical protein